MPGNRCRNRWVHANVNPPRRPAPPLGGFSTCTSWGLQCQVISKQSQEERVDAVAKSLATVNVPITREKRITAHQQQSIDELQIQNPRIAELQQEWAISTTKLETGNWSNGVVSEEGGRG